MDKIFDKLFVVHGMRSWGDEEERRKKKRREEVAGGGIYTPRVEVHGNCTRTTREMHGKCTGVRSYLGCPWGDPPFLNFPSSTIYSIS